LAHVGVAAAQSQSTRARFESLAIARSLVRTATRRERQHVEVVATALSSNTSRALALCGEHLREFPRDVVVLTVITNAVAMARDETLSVELNRLAQAVNRQESDGSTAGS
jgi:hypothetical protein